MTAPAPARSRAAARWIAPPGVDAAAVETLASTLHLPPTLATLLVQRGLADSEAARRYLRPRREHLTPPETLRSMDVAVERLVRAIRTGETVLVHGDYDVDGMCSTALLVEVLGTLGATAVPFTPHRLTDGYDLTEAGVREAQRVGATLVLTADCGTSARAPIAQLTALGIDTIVSDHHLPGGPLPDCVAVLNPRRPDCDSPDKDFAAVGIAFKLALALCRAVGASENLAWRQLDLVALATVADLAPLRGENRVLVRYGLKLLTETERPGLRALLRSSGSDGKPITAGTCGFTLAPRLNAVGRMDSAMVGVELLLTRDQGRANELARRCEELNTQRQALDQDVLRQAMRQVDTLDLDATVGLVLAGDAWHPGVIGIVASRVVEAVARPTFVIGLDGDTGKGSGRSIGGFDLHGGLVKCGHHLVKFGGHRAAAGLTIARDRVDAFRTAFNDAVRETLAVDDCVHERRIDLVVGEDDLTDALAALLEHCEPYGLGNPRPVLLVPGARVHGTPRILKEKHLKLEVKVGETVLGGIGFGMADRREDATAGTALDLAARLEINEYRGRRDLQLQLVDLRPAVG
ncbi:MAG: single-stranded-DNA-specific exonuclease RecJ [Gemmatimonadaceae bacterium]|nr:single-stranded-DNA-specific exonuclease RecJ [Gemmatimonadaceae bacterium]